MEEAVKLGFAASPSSSSIPKNYISLRQLRDLRLKEKQNEEERLRIQNLHLNQQQQQQQTEGNRLKEDSLPYPNLNPTKEDIKEEGEPKLHPKPPGSRIKRSPIRAVARPEPARRAADDGPEGSATEADPKRVIGDAVGDPRPQGSQMCNQTREMGKKKNRKKKKGKDGKEKPERLEAMPASVYANPKVVSLENGIQLKKGGGPDRRERAKQKPVGLQCSGSQQMMQIEQQSINASGIPTSSEAERTWSAPRGGRSFPRPGRGGVVGRRGPRVGAAAGLVWVKKTAGS